MKVLLFNEISVSLENNFQEINLNATRKSLFFRIIRNSEYIVGNDFIVAMENIIKIFSTKTLL